MAIVSPRGWFLRQLVNAGHRQLRQQNTRSASQQAQRQSLRKHLADEPHAMRPQRRSNRKLLLPPQAARDQQVRNIRTCNQQHQRQRREQSVEHGTHWSSQHFLISVDAELYGTFGCLPRNVRGNRIQFLLRLRDGHSGAKFADDIEEIVTSIFQHLWRRLQRHPHAFRQIRPQFFRKAKTSRHHPYHGARLAIDLHSPAYNSRIGMKGLPP